ncbi:olfactory receptor 142-like [Protopterus annectens]|uniref:olfactory receptor 142-like n=1 Tax=Protopterus annectens TaxID=7888 RepID=UPI001CFB4407|nr:olfactory receptor 142-like [Protopterus annectens]
MRRHCRNERGAKKGVEAILKPVAASYGGPRIIDAAGPLVLSEPEYCRLSFELHFSKLKRMEYVSNWTTLILTGFDETDQFKYTYFVVCLIIYLLSSFVNALLISIIVLHHTLHKPMYIFVCNLCLNGMYGSTIIFPKLLIDMLSEDKSISYISCILQTFFLYICGFNELSLLTLMAYDRYLSICNPLKYVSIMTKARVRILLVVPWFYSFCLVLSCLSPTIGYPICSNTIEDFFCNILTFLKLSCTVLTIAHVNDTCISIINSTVLIAVIVYSYAQIFRVSYKASGGAKVKALNTCTTHLLLLFLYFTSGIFALLQSRLQWINNIDVPILTSISSLIIPGFLNPVIYGIRTHEIRKTMQNVIRKRKMGFNVKFING